MISKRMILVATVGSLFLSGCFMKTRTEVKEQEKRSVMQSQVVDLQKSTAEVSTRFTDLQDELRNMNGRIEILEKKYQDVVEENQALKKGNSDGQSEQTKKIALLQEGLLKLEGQVASLATEIESLRAVGASASSAASKGKGDEKQDHWKVGTELIKSGDYRKSILSLQKYRDENPKGKYFADATYLIGMNFLELGMKDEAKSFFEEVVNNHPKSKVAPKAKSRLKSIK